MHATQEQLAAALQKSRDEAAQNPLTAESFKAARQTMQDAGARVADLEEKISNAPMQYQAGPRRDAYILNLQQELQDAREAHSEALAVYGSMYHRGGPGLEAQAREQALRKRQEQAQAQRQAEFAQEQEQAAKVEYRVRYLAAGGTDEQFESAWPGIWRGELKRRTHAGEGTMVEKLRETGRYSL
jgi:hypothetical protein